LWFILILELSFLIYTHQTTALTPSQEEWDQAVDYLQEHLPEETKAEVRIAMQDPNWPVDYHHSFGMEIRNMLRDGGFDWGDIELEDNWDELVKEAVTPLSPS
jgi:hypothetical protein